jgi:hypothetical protein
VPDGASARRSDTTRDTLTLERRTDNQQLFYLASRYLEEDDWREKERLYENLKVVYGHYTSKYRIAPDLSASKSRELPPPKAGTDLDAYLDRQFTLLRDRDFPVERTSTRAPEGRRSRLVVIEYPTGFG